MDQTGSIGAKTMKAIFISDRQVTTQKGAAGELDVKVVLKPLDTSGVSHDGDQELPFEQTGPLSLRQMLARLDRDPTCHGAPWDFDECKGQITIDALGELAKHYFSPGERFVVTFERF